MPRTYFTVSIGWINSQISINNANLVQVNAQYRKRKTSMTRRLLFIEVWVWSLTDLVVGKQSNIGRGFSNAACFVQFFVGFFNNKHNTPTQMELIFIFAAAVDLIITLLVFSLLLIHFGNHYRFVCRCPCLTHAGKATGILPRIGLIYQLCGFIFCALVTCVTFFKYKNNNYFSYVTHTKYNKYYSNYKQGSTINTKQNKTICHNRIIFSQ